METLAVVFETHPSPPPHTHTDREPTCMNTTAIYTLCDSAHSCMPGEQTFGDAAGLLCGYTCFFTILWFCYMPLELVRLLLL